jgi:hypothetical protein
VVELTMLAAALLQPPAKAKYAPLAGRPQHPDLLAAVVFEPERITKSVAAVKLSLAPLWKMIETDARLKVKEVARAELYVEPESTGPVPFWWMAALKFTGKGLAEKNARAMLDAPAGGRNLMVPGLRTPFIESPRYKFTEREYWGAALPDANIAVFGPRRLVWRSMGPGDKITSLGASLELVDANHDLSLAIGTEALQKFLEKVNTRRRSAGGEDPALALAAKTASLATTAVVSIDIAKGPMLRAEFAAVNEQSVPALAAGVENGLAMLRKTWPEIRMGLLGGADEANGKAALAAFDHAVKNAKVEAGKRSVTVTVSRPADWPPK